MFSNSFFRVTIRARDAGCLLNALFITDLHDFVIQAGIGGHTHIAAAVSCSWLRYCDAREAIKQMGDGVWIICIHETKSRRHPPFLCNVHMQYELL